MPNPFPSILLCRCDGGYFSVGWHGCARKGRIFRSVYGAVHHCIIPSTGCNDFSLPQPRNENRNLYIRTFCCGGVCTSDADTMYHQSMTTFNAYRWQRPERSFSHSLLVYWHFIEYLLLIFHAFVSCFFFSFFIVFATAAHFFPRRFSTFARCERSISAVITCASLIFVSAAATLRDRM